MYKWDGENWTELNQKHLTSTDCGNNLSAVSADLLKKGVIRSNWKCGTGKKTQTRIKSTTAHQFQYKIAQNSKNMFIYFYLNAAPMNCIILVRYGCLADQKEHFLNPVDLFHIAIW